MACSPVAITGGGPHPLLVYTAVYKWLIPGADSIPSRYTLLCIRVMWLTVAVVETVVTLVVVLSVIVEPYLCSGRSFATIESSQKFE